jgi:alanine dehydrogenase
VKRLLILLLLATQTVADSNSMSFSLPSISSVSGSDSIRAGDLDCKNAIGGSTNFEIGMTGVINNAVVPIIGKKDNLNPETKDIGLYARIIIPLDGPKERINCNTLYQLELQRRRLEVERLKQEIEYLKMIQNEGAFNN